MEKKLLRKHGKTLLQNISEDSRKSIQKRISRKLFSSGYWKNASTIGVTISRAYEWDTELIIDRAWADRKEVCVPKCYPDTSQLVFHKLTDYNQLECVYMDLREPKPEETEVVEKNKIDLLIVPGLLFDHNGYRIGYGGGYYDRFLVGFDNTTLAIACEKQMMDMLPTNQFDIPVQHLVTENGVLF